MSRCPITLYHGKNDALFLRGPYGNGFNLDDYKGSELFVVAGGTGVSPIDATAPGGKEYIGYIIDRTGFEEYKKWALKGITLPLLAEVTHQLYWGGPKY